MSEPLNLQAKVYTCLENVFVITKNNHLSFLKGLNGIV